MGRHVRMARLAVDGNVHVERRATMVCLTRVVVLPLAPC